jgi:acyl-coenzyme A thioesterase PaaI-like protein
MRQPSSCDPFDSRRNATFPTGGHGPDTARRPHDGAPPAATAQVVRPVRRSVRSPVVPEPAPPPVTDDPVAARVDRFTTGPRSSPAPDAERAAAALRTLGERIVRMAPDAGPTAGFGALADELEALLARHDVGPLPVSRYLPGAATDPDGLQANERGAHPIIGPANPSAPPVRFDAVEGRAVGLVTFSAVQEGFPGHAHGGWIAAVFDMVLGVATAASPAPGGLTGTLAVRYLRLTPIAVPLRFEAWYDRTEGRKTFVRGSLHRLDRDSPRSLCAEAEGVFIRPNR